MMMWPGIPSLKCIIPTLTYEPIDANLGLSGALTPNDADGRLLFYLKSRTFSNTANDGKGFFTKFSDKIPLYLPGEIMLIKAECAARKNDLLQP